MKNFSRRSFLEVSALGAVALGGTSVLTKSLLEGAAQVIPTATTHRKFSHWSFGGAKFASPVDAQSIDFRFWFTPAAERKTYSFRHEVFRALRELDRKREGATVALCYSGGVDSDVLARAMSQLGIPYEMYFLDFWGQNQNVFKGWAKSGASKLGKELHVVSLERESFLARACEDFLITGCESPTYLGMAQLFDRIPADQFIVTGDGDLDRRGRLFSHLGYKYPVNNTAPGTPISFSVSSVAHNLWAQAKGRKGEFYFFRSTPGLIAAALTSPNFKAGYPFSDAKGVVHTAFPEIKARPKTTNWEGREGVKENRKLRRFMERVAVRSETYRFWRRLAGTVVNADDIFFKG